LGGTVDEVVVVGSGAVVVVDELGGGAGNVVVVVLVDVVEGGVVVVVDGGTVVVDELGGGVVVGEGVWASAATGHNRAMATTIAGARLSERRSRRLPRRVKGPGRAGSGKPRMTARTLVAGWSVIRSAGLYSAVVDQKLSLGLPAVNETGGDRRHSPLPPGPFLIKISAWRRVP
jgi:hypothetical protein